MLVPIIVIDELDGLKRSSKTRWRAGYTLAVIDKLNCRPDLARITSPAERESSSGRRDHSDSFRSA